MTHRMLRRSLALLAALLAVACGGDGPTDPGNSRQEGDLVFLVFDQAAPPLEASSISFWAKKGEDAEGQLFFLDSQGQRGAEFARLKIPGQSLLSRPDGTSIAVGDSVFITMRVTDPARLLVELLPSGLTFSTTVPAELKLDYDFADHDFDRDGDKDSADQSKEQLFAIWRQEFLGDPWVRLGTVKIEGLEEVEAKLFGFSRFALAY